MPPRRRLACCLALPLVLSALSGCGSSNVVPVTGTLKYKGKPVPNVLVNFVPEAGRPSVGRTDNDGRFTLDYDRTTKGAEIGKHKVYVMLPPGRGATVPGQQEVQTGDVRELLAKYGPDKSKVEVTVDRNTSAIPLDWD